MDAEALLEWAQAIFKYPRYSTGHGSLVQADHQAAAESYLRWWVPGGGGLPNEHDSEPPGLTRGYMLGPLRWRRLEPP